MTVFKCHLMSDVVKLVWLGENHWRCFAAVLLEILPEGQTAFLLYDGGNGCPNTQWKQI